MVATPRPRIAILPPEIAARIAAGEVIERPASVVKELLENALDAGATLIEVEIEGGGIDRIRLRDNGCGIPPDQVADAFERHATSKLRSEHDLFAVRTLGFRGEALAAIAAAASVDLTTRPVEQEGAATVRVRNGRIERQGSAAAAAGTVIDVRDLFAALPARRRFLRAPRAEARAVVQVVSDYALAYPEVAFRLVTEGRTALNTPGSGDPRDAVAAVHGVDVAGALLPVRHARAEADGASVEVAGLAGAPSLHRGSRGALHFVANGRTIVSRSLTHAVEQAYEGLIPAGRHPVALVRITVPPDQIDVNVHPTKAEVRFRHERLVYAAVGAAVRAALGGALTPEAPALDAVPLLPPPSMPPGERPVFAWTPPGDAPDTRPEVPADAPSGRSVVASAQGVSFVPERAPSEAGLPLTAAVPVLRPLGQVELTYIVAEAPDGMYLVDQHAAHERVLYEQALARRATGEVASQPLLDAAVVTLSASQVSLVEEAAEALAAVGWSIAPADGTAVIVRAVPPGLPARDPARALNAFLDRLAAEERLTGPDRVAATLACRAAVMAGDRLDQEQQRALLRALEACDTPHTCPHGRPTMLHLSRAALERSFGRR